MMAGQFVGPCRLAARHGTTSSNPISSRGESIANRMAPGAQHHHRVIKNLSTAVLALVSGKFDMAFPYSLTVPLLKDVKSQMPQAMCEMGPVGLNRNLLVNRDVPPFDNPDLRRAMALSLDRPAFIDILTEGQGDIGGVMQPAPAGLWGMPPDMLQTLSGYGPNIQLNRAALARSCISSVMGPITGSRSRCRCATSSSQLHLRA